MSGQITAYIKPTNRCPIDCSHCYLPLAVRQSKDRMSFDSLRKSAELLAQMQERQRSESIHVIWHGGEPMAMPVDWFWKAGEILDEILPGHTESIQTSLIPYQKPWAELARARFLGEIGSSMDFTSRSFKGSHEAYQQFWMKKVDAARAEGILILPGVTPGRPEMAMAGSILDWFEEREFGIVNFERYNQYGQHLPDRPSNAEHSVFLSRLFDAVKTRLVARGHSIMARVVAAGLRGILVGAPGDRWGGSCMSDFIVFEPNGDLNNCPDKSSIETPFSNVADGFGAFQASPLRRKWIRLQQAEHRISDCATCENRHFCKSGCPITPNACAEEGEQECSGYRSFLSHARREMADPALRVLFEEWSEGNRMPPYFIDFMDKRMMHAPSGHSHPLVGARSPMALLEAHA